MRLSLRVRLRRVGLHKAVQRSAMHVAQLAPSANIDLIA